MKILFRIGLALIALVIIIVVAAYCKAPEYHVERSLHVEASPEKTYAVFSDLQQFPKWSPWEKLDPAMKKTITNSSYAWAGNDQVGEGLMTVTNSVLNERVEIKLAFLKPFASECQTVWAVAKDGDGSKVTWTMDGRNEGVLARVMGLLFNMDKMIGPDFQRGLENLKKLVIG